MDNNLSPGQLQKNSQHNLGIRGRLLAGYATVVLVFITSVLVSLYFIFEVKKDAMQFISYDIPATHSVVDLQASMMDIRLDMQTLLFINDSATREKIDQNISDMNGLVKRIDSYVVSINNSVISDGWSSLKLELSAYMGKVSVVLQLLDSNQKEKAIDTYKSIIIPASRKLVSAFNVDMGSGRQHAGLQDELNNLLVADMSDINKQINFIFLSTLIFLLLSVIISYISATITSRSIVNPIKYAIVIANSVASGERDININVDKHDETGLLLDSLNKMKNSIKESEEKIRQKSEENEKLYHDVVKAANLFSEHSGRVASGDLTRRLELNGGLDQEMMQRLGQDLNKMTDNLSSVTKDIMGACSSMVSTLDEVRHAVDAQSSGASEQASSINQITASITEIEKSAAQTMNKARDLGGVAEKTRQSGQMGLESIENSVMGMKSVKDKVQMIAQTILDLSRQTQQVGEITAVVNNLAQQSKMLALNASIEAAKAGDAGKGFAVVAAEVKNLAEQSEQSTSQVQKILEDIKIATEKAVMVTEEGTKGVENGLQMIEKTGDVIRDLNEVIREASIASQQIEAAVRQESAGIEQITAGMNEINTVTASFVDSVAQTTEAMDGLSGVARKLKSSVEIYKV